MFTWICPQCGREVPPSYTECPDCTAKSAAQGATPSSAPAAGPLQPASAPAAPPAPVQQPYAPAPVAAPTQPAPMMNPPAAHGLPTWLMTIVFAFAFVGLVGGVYWIVNYVRSRPVAKPVAAVESPAAKPGTAVNPYQKFIEIAGVRFVEDPQHKDKAMVRVVIVNHSPADILGLKGNVTVWGSTARAEEDAQGTFTFEADLKPFESKEVTEPLSTKKQIYELADWQNITTDVQITAPVAGSPGQ